MEHADPEPAIIRVGNLEHTYGDFRAVDNITFSVKKGEIFSFLGPNGAGKSTVINILITLLARQKGTAVVAGFDVTTQPQQVRESIGIAVSLNPVRRASGKSNSLAMYGGYVPVL